MNDVKERFIQAFNVAGEFGINAQQLRDSKLFSNGDILEMDNAENLEKLKQLYYKLNNTDENFETITSKINVKNNLLSKLNPDEFIQNSYDIYIGAQTQQDVVNIANEIGDDLLLENNSLTPLVLDAVKNKQNLAQYELDELSGEIIRKSSNDMFVKLQQTLDMNQDFSSLIDQIDFIRSRPINVFVEDLGMVSMYMSNLEKQASDLGIDILGLAETMEDKNYEDITDYLDSLYNFLYDVNESKAQDVLESIGESLPSYVEAYNTFFGVEPIFRTAVADAIKRNGVYLHLETNLSEEDLFKTNSILKVQGNVYQKITDDKALNDLYSLLFENPSLIPNGVLSIKPTEINRDLVYEEIDQHVSNESKNYLTETSDIEAIKKIVIYKMLLSIDNSNTELTLNGLDNLDVNQFLIDFHKLSLNNSKVRDIFYFSNRGLEAKRMIGEFTAQDIKNSISERAFDSLVLYSKISGNESLSQFTNFNNDISSENMRDYYANNMSQLPVFQGTYTRQNGYVVANTNSEFLNIKNSLYEQVSPNVYAEVQRDERYINYNLSKPSYDNSVELDMTNQQGATLEVKKMKNINDDNVEFC
jgi:hypothetical protein